MGCCGIKEGGLDKEKMKKFLLDNLDLVDKDSEEFKEIEVQEMNKFNKY